MENQDMYYNAYITEHLGVLEDGILCLASVQYMGKFYEATYWYNNLDDEVFQVDQELLDLFQIENNDAFKNSDIYDKLITRIRPDMSDYNQLREELRSKQY